jgi:hypothetical protein
MQVVGRSEQKPRFGEQRCRVIQIDEAGGDGGGRRRRRRRRRRVVK